MTKSQASQRERRKTATVGAVSVFFVFAIISGTVITLTSHSAPWTAYAALSVPGSTGVLCIGWLFRNALARRPKTIDSKSPGDPSPTDAASVEHTKPPFRRRAAGRVGSRRSLGAYLHR